MTQKQFRDIETNETDLESQRVEKQKETENGRKPKTVKGRQNEPEQKGQTAKQDRREKDKKTEKQTDETVSH